MVVLYRCYAVATTLLLRVEILLPALPLTLHDLALWVYTSLMLSLNIYLTIGPILGSLKIWMFAL